MRLGVCAMAIICVWASAPGRAATTDWSDLTRDQAETAQCMLSVVKAEPRVKDASIRVSTTANQAGPTATPPTVYLDYTYNHASRGIYPKISPREIDITQVIESKHGGFSLGGLLSSDAPDLNDNDAGLISITKGWIKKCGLALFVTTE
jgi:hypothetical protein